MSYEHYQLWKTKPLTGDILLSVVIPAYNEEVRIVPTIGAIASYISDLGIPWELIVADDGSRDRTAQLVEELGFVNLRLLRAARNAGKGNAVHRGMMAARGQYVLFTDADNSTPIEEISKLLHKVEQEGYAIAIGSRAAEGAAEGHKSWIRHLLSGGLRWLVRVLFRIGVRDTQCGFKLYSREAAHRLHRAQTIMGFSFDLEILYLAAKWGYRIAEVPVNWIDAPGSKVDMRREVKRFVRDLFRIKWNDLRGVYAKA